jgi:hypothetical protein
MSASYLALRALVAGDGAYAALSPGDAASALNEETISTFVDVPWSALREILMGNGDWGTLVYTERRASGAFLGGAAYSAATQVMAIEFADSCRFGGTLRTSDPDVRTRVGGRLNTLAGATVAAISAASREQMIDLATRTISPAASIGWPAVTEHDVTHARSL